MEGFECPARVLDLSCYSSFLIRNFSMWRFMVWSDSFGGSTKDGFGEGKSGCRDQGGSSGNRRQRVNLGTIISLSLIHI